MNENGGFDEEPEQQACFEAGMELKSTALKAIALFFYV